VTAVLGIDLGGTAIKAAVVDEYGGVHGTATGPSAEADGPAVWAAAGIEVAGRALAGSGLTPTSLGLSVPGAVDPDRGLLVDLVDRMEAGAGVALQEAFGGLRLPVVADNDARAALSAERRWGVATGLDDVVMLTVGTGLGGAALVHGVAPGGDAVLAGNQLGHLILDLDGPACVCGNRGCAETYASATGLLRLADEAALHVDSVPDIFTSAAGGDDAAASVVGTFARALGVAVVNAIHAYQPKLVVLGGGVMGSASHFLPQVQDFVERRAWTRPRGGTQVVASGLGADVGVLGAAAVAFRRTTPTIESRRAS
jgi:glucokinase